MTSKELADKVQKRLDSFDVQIILDYLKDTPDKNALMEREKFIRDEWEKEYKYHQWLACLMLEVKPKLVVELGADYGTSAASMLSTMPKDSKLYSVDIRNGWELINPKESRIVRVLGDSLDLDKMVPELNLKTVDIWFLDSDHSYNRIAAEVEYYKKYWQKGTIVLIDDITWERDNFGVHKLWDELRYDKVELNHLHYSGFGMFVV